MIDITLFIVIVLDIAKLGKRKLFAHIPLRFYVIVKRNVMSQGPLKKKGKEGKTNKKTIDIKVMFGNPCKSALLRAPPPPPPRPKSSLFRSRIFKLREFYRNISEFAISLEVSSQIMQHKLGFSTTFYFIFCTFL